MIHRTETWLRAVAFPGAWHLHRLVFVAIACLTFVCVESVQELRATEG